MRDDVCLNEVNYFQEDSTKKKKKEKEKPFLKLLYKEVNKNYSLYFKIL